MSARGAVRIRRTLCGLCCLGLLTGAPAAEAVTLTVSFTGTVSTVPAELAAAFNPCDPVSGSFQIESTTPDIDADPTFGLYIGPANFSYQFDSYVATAPGGGGGDSVGVLNQAEDRYQVNGGCGMCAPNVDSFFLTNFTLRLVDSTATVFANDALPMSLDLSDFDSGIATMIFQHDTLPSKSVIADLTSISVVPEPGTGSLLVLGALGLALRRRA